MEMRRSRPFSWTGTQTQYGREPVEEFEKIRENTNIVPSLASARHTHPDRGEWSREVFFNLSGGVLCSGYGESHSLVFLCVPRERAGVWKCVTLGSPIVEFQAVAATWGFRFLWCHFHICQRCSMYPTPAG
jgi:hypothetical protein